jgi:LysM repeat protein
MNPRDQRRRASGRTTWLVVTVILLAGCGSAATTIAPAATSPTATDLSTPALAETAPVRVVTPPQPSTPSSASSTAVAPTRAPTAAPMFSPPPGVGDYFVVAGDTLRDIAQRYDLTVEELIAANDPAANWDRDWNVLAVGERIQLWRELLMSPDGTPYGVNYDIHFNASDWPVHSSRIAALDPDGRARPGWPYLTTDRASRPVFGADGTVYLTLSAGPEENQGPGEIIALGPDGRMKAGWPYLVPGSLPFAEPGPGPVVSVPQPPTVAPDGSVYGTFHSGIYRVRPDGRAASGWPYLLPSGTGVATCCLGDIPGPPEGSVFKPDRTSDGRFFLPRHDGRYANEHVDMMCLLDDGTLCAGWPVKLPDGASVSDFSVDKNGIVDITLAGLSGEFFDSVPITIRQDGTLFHRVKVGETLSGLADAFGVTQAALLAANPQITDPSLIHPGDLLTIPGGSSVP